MKRILIFMTLMFVAFFSNGQTITENGKLFNNTYIGASVSGQTNMRNLSLKAPIYPTANLYFGKWLTPNFALEANGEAIFHVNFKAKQRLIDGTYVGLSGILNLNNFLGTYNGQPDKLEVLPIAGLGWLHSYGRPMDNNLKERIDVNALSTKMGIRLAINLGEKRATQLFLQPNVNYILGGMRDEAIIHFNINRARVGMEFGIIYKFRYKNSKNQKVHNFTLVPVPYYSQKEYDNRDKDTVIQEVIKEVELVKEVEVIKEKEVIKYIVKPYFTNGSAVLDQTSKVMLSEFANMNKDNNVNFRIEGYASEEGNYNYNQRLSLKRAEAVKNELVKNGIDANRLNTIGMGETTTFGDKYEDNRIVIIVEM